MRPSRRSWIRHVLIAIAVAALFGAAQGPALAAGLLPSPEPYAPPPPPMWNGFYIGGNVGGTWSDSDHVRTVSQNVFMAPIITPPH
jgi:hypothetical protein